ncbi:hypothetical protein BDR07DRAFT_1479831 [Suillus spraguei]|nr:hypothetical protein BDR07DRAFT_1479831 [Suillus spraguei]
MRVVDPQTALLCVPIERVGGWCTGDVVIIENGVSYGIPELETRLQTVEGVAYLFLAAAT